MKKVSKVALVLLMIVAFKVSYCAIRNVSNSEKRSTVPSVVPKTSAKTSLEASTEAEATKSQQLTLPGVNQSKPQVKTVKSNDVSTSTALLAQIVQTAQMPPVSIQENQSVNNQSSVVQQVATTVLQKATSGKPVLDDQKIITQPHVSVLQEIENTLELHQEEPTSSQNELSNN